MNPLIKHFFWLLLSVAVLVATTGCENKAVGIDLCVPVKPITQPFPATVARGQTVHGECVTYGVGGRFSRLYQGKVQVQIEAGPGLTVTPNRWEMVMAATNDRPRASQMLSITVGNAAPSGTNQIKIIVTRKDGGKNDRLVEFVVE